MVTLDIEDTSIRMMVVKGRRVELAATFDLDRGLVEDGFIADRAAVGQRIRELMETYGISERKVVVSLSGIHSMYRLVRMPRLPKGLLEEAATREMGRVMPVPLDEIYTSWQVVSISDVENVFCLVGVPRNTVDAVEETLRGAGLESRVMDVRPLAIARIADDKDALIINVQPASFDIVLMIDGIPELLRSLPFPSGDMSEADKVETIIEEIERTVSFYNSSHKASPVNATTSAFISGELKEMLAEQLGYNVKPLPAMLSYPEEFNVDDYVVNIGLALKQVRYGNSRIRININTVGKRYLPKPLPVMAIASWAFVVIAVIILVSMVMLTGQAIKKTSALQDQVDNIQRQVQVKQGTVKEVESLRASLEKGENALKAYQQPLTNLAAQRVKFVGDLGSITSQLLGTIDLDLILYKEKQWTISGTAPDEATVLLYSFTLSETGNFDDVRISTMNVIDYDKVGFTLNLINEVD